MVVGAHPAIASARRAFNWHRCLDGAYLSVGEVVARAEDIEPGQGDDSRRRRFMFPDFHDALLTVAGRPGGALSAKRLGHWLKRNDGKITGDLRLQSQWDNHAKVNRWRVGKVTEQ
jgi:hypothetical protein